MVTRSSQSHTSRYQTICRCHPPPSRLQYRLYPKNVKMLNLPKIDVNNFTFKISVGNVIVKLFLLFSEAVVCRDVIQNRCVIRNSAIFTGKHLLESLHYNLMPKETSSKKIPVKNAKFLQQSFFCGTPLLWWLLLLSG